MVLATAATAGTETHSMTPGYSVAACARSRRCWTDSALWLSIKPDIRSEAMAIRIPGVKDDPFLHSFFTTRHLPSGGFTRGGGGPGLTTGVPGSAGCISGIPLSGGLGGGPILVP